MNTYFSHPQFGLLQSFYCCNEDNVNLRKMGGEETPSAATPQQQHQIVFSLQSPEMLHPFQYPFQYPFQDSFQYPFQDSFQYPFQHPFHLQSQTPQLVSTGLQLAVFDHPNNQIGRELPYSVILAYLLKEFVAHMNMEKWEIDQYLIALGEQLRLTLTEMHKRHYLNLFESAGKKLLQKEAEIERAGHCILALKNWLSHLENESDEWQLKAFACQAEELSVRAQLQKAAADAAAVEAEAADAASAAPDANENCKGPQAEDADSAHVDPNRNYKPERPCRACFFRQAIVVVLPCRHLSLCVSCDLASTVVDACPVCRCFKTASLQVSFY